MLSVVWNLKVVTVNKRTECATMGRLNRIRSRGHARDGRCIMARITFTQVQFEQTRYNANRDEDEPYIVLRRNNGCIFIDFYRVYDAMGGYRMIYNDSYGHSTREAWRILHELNEHRAAMELMK